MRQQASGSRYAAGTKIDSHRSRAELARLLTRYGANDFVILEHDANATIRFALHGKYVQYVLPLPDPDSPDFTHTPTGRLRAFTAQERVYEQAVRQQWRRAVLVVKGKLEAVESGLSTFEREFYGAIQDDERRDRPAPLLLRRKFRWAPETMLLLLCLGVLVPASGAVALGVPSVAVERLASPVWGDQPDPFGGSEDGHGSAPGNEHALRLGSGALAAAPVSDSLVTGGPTSPGSTSAQSAGGSSGKGKAKGNGNGGSGTSPVSAHPSPSDGNGGTASPLPPPASTPPANSGGSGHGDSTRGLGSQQKGNGWDNGNKGNGTGAAAGGKKK